MESSTIDNTAAQTEETTSAPVTFHSEASNFRLVREPQRTERLAETNQFAVVGGREYQFYDGVLTVTDPDDIDWLRNYESNGKYYWEVGSPEDRPANSAATQAQIIKLAMAGDFATIGDILVAERSALSRPEVIAACEAAINAGGQQLPAKPDTPLHELQRVRMGPTAGQTPGVSPDPVPETPMVDPSTLTAPPGEPAAPVPQPPAGDTIPPSETVTQEPAPEPPLAPAPPVEEPAPGSAAAETETTAPPEDPSAGGAAGAPATS